MVVVIKAPIVFLFQTLVKKMFLIAEADPHRRSSVNIILSIHVINVKSSMSWRYIIILYYLV